MQTQLVGRDNEIVALEATVLDDGVGVCIRGERGAGKTVLYERLLDRIDQTLPVLRITPSASAQQIAFGALAPHLAESAASQMESVQMLAAAGRALQRNLGSDTVGIGVDDVWLLDSSSATVIAQLAREPGVLLLVTCVDSEAVPRWVRQLIQADRVRDFTLDRLDRLGVEQLVKEVVGGEADGSVRDELWNLSAGNPLRVRQLVASAIADGSIAETDGAWRLKANLVPRGLLAASLDEQTASCSPTEARVLELLAVVGLTPVAFLDHAEGAESVEALESAGLVKVRTEGGRASAELSDALLERHLNESVPITRARRLNDLFVSWLASCGLQRANDELQLAKRHLKMFKPLSNDLGLTAAGQALAVGDPICAGNIGQAVPADERAFDLNLIIAEALAVQGRCDEATDALLATESPSQPPSERVQVALVRSRVARLQSADLGAARAIIARAQQLTNDDNCLHELAIELGFIELLQGSPNRTVPPPHLEVEATDGLRWRTCGFAVHDLSER